MNKRAVSILFLTVVALFIFLISGGAEAPVSSQYNSFARCLAGKGVTMYGADWCGYCQTEKAAFGKSFQYVPYVECPDNIQLCLDKKIAGYPAWIFPDGRKLDGLQGLENLSRESGCRLLIK